MTPRMRRAVLVCVAALSLVGCGGSTTLAFGIGAGDTADLEVVAAGELVEITNEGPGDLEVTFPGAAPVTLRAGATTGHTLERATVKLVAGDRAVRVRATADGDVGLGMIQSPGSGG